jgi:hypothetical protein
MSSDQQNTDARRMDADAAIQLERFAASPAMANGQINLLSLDAIADRLGARWEAKRARAQRRPIGLFPQGFRN